MRQRATSAKAGTPCALGDSVLGGGIAELRTALGDEVVVSFGNQPGIDELAPHADGEGTGGQKVGERFEIDAARREEFDVGEGRFEGPNVFGATEGIARKDFDGVAAGFPSGQDLGRSKSPGEDGAAIAASELDGLRIETGSDEKLRAGEHRGAGGFGIEHGSSTEQDAAAVAVGEDFDGPERMVNSHGNFYAFQATREDGFRRGDGSFRGRRSDDGNNGGLLDPAKDVGVIQHWRGPRRAKSSFS